MGKKRSKTSKLKQARASRKFGVAVKKGGTKEPSSSTAQILSTSSSSKGFKRSSTTSATSSFMSKQTNNDKNRPSNSRRGKAERDDFDRQMASVQERQSAAELRKVGKRRMATTNLTPAILVVDDKKKSTSRLVEEATSSLSQGLDGLGGGPSSITRLLMQSSDRWSSTQPATLLERDNPYAVLGTGDSSDDEEAARKPPTARSTLPLFQFVPPSFAVATTATTQVSHNTTNDDEDDPDL